MSHLETEIVAVERIGEYTRKETEAHWRPGRGSPAVVAPFRWPLTGAITLEDYSLRYRSGMDLVLKDVSCSMRSGEKVIPVVSHSFFWCSVKGTRNPKIKFVPKSIGWRVTFIITGT